MKKLLLLFLVSLLTEECLGQFENTQRKNYLLLDSLENIYLTPCIEYKAQNVSKKKFRKDKKLIETLNQAYLFRFTINFRDELKELGFEETVPEIRVDAQGRNIYKYYKHLGGNIRGFVQLAVIDSKVVYQRVLISTDSKFFCKTESSYNHVYIDFIYLKRLVSNINIPLRIAASNTEIEGD